MDVPNFDTLRKNLYSVLTCQLQNFPICFQQPNRKLSSLSSGSVVKHFQETLRTACLKMLSVFLQFPMSLITTRLVV